MVDFFLLFECWCGAAGLIYLLPSGGHMEAMVRRAIPAAGHEQVSTVRLLLCMIFSSYTNRASHQNNDFC